MCKSDIWRIFVSSKADGISESSTIISVISLLSNLDNGIVPASTQSIKDDLKANDSEIGLFGSGDYLGRIALVL